MIENKDFLSSFGNILKTADGRIVSLRGTNFGGWLVYEEWMGAVTGASAGLDLIEALEKRFGKEKADELLKVYQDNYITEKDFDRIASLGFNCLRLPFWYKTIENGDFSRLDYAIEECGKRGIYVILDFHGLPGFQSIAHHCGKINDCHLYEETPLGEECRKKSAEMWISVAERYKDNPVVAGYDLMNEPMCDFDENQDDEAMQKVYDLFYKAVRSVDEKHILIFEAIWDFDHLPDPARAGWKNVMYELHSYDPSDEAYFQIIEEAEKKMYCVPILVGEFHPSDKEAHWEYILRLYNRNYINWTTWTFKGHSQSGNSDWFMFCRKNSEFNVDLFNDSFEAIKEKWGLPLRTENFSISNDLEMFKKYAEEPLKNEKLASLCGAYQNELFNAKFVKGR